MQSYFVAELKTVSRIRIQNKNFLFIRLFKMKYVLFLCVSQVSWMLGSECRVSHGAESGKYLTQGLNSDIAVLVLEPSKQ